MIGKDATEKFFDKFPDEVSCQEFLARIRWSGDSGCPKCNGDTHWPAGNGRYSCRRCGQQVSLTARTGLHRIKQSLHKVFHGIWLITTTSHVLSNSEFCRTLSIANRHTGNGLLGHLRALLPLPRGKLLGRVGWGKIKLLGKHVFIGVEAQERGPKGVKLQRFNGPASSAIGSFFHDHVEGSAVVFSRGWRKFLVPNGVRVPIFLVNRAFEAGYRHSSVEAAKRALAAMDKVARKIEKQLPPVHRGRLGKGVLDGMLREIMFKHASGRAWGMSRLQEVLRVVVSTQ